MDIERKVSDLKFAGSHDSAAYQFANVYMSGKLAGLSLKFLEFLRRGCFKNIISDWTLTQDKTIYEQLNMGVRAFDLRISQVKDRLMLSHSFGCLWLEDFYEQLTEYMDHNKAVVLIFVKPDWIHKTKLTMKHWEQFYEMSYKYLLPRMMSRGDIPTVWECPETCAFVNVYYDGYTNQQIPYHFWTNLNAHFAQVYLTKTPTVSVVRKDVLLRIFCPFYKKKSLRSENPPTIDTINSGIYWMDFPSEKKITEDLQITNIIFY